MTLLQIGLYMVAGISLLIALAILVVILRYGIPYALYRLERHKRGTVPSPFGPVHPPTNSELRRARREHSGAKGS